MDFYFSLLGGSPPPAGGGKRTFLRLLASLFLLLFFGTPCWAAETYTLEAVLLDGKNGGASELLLFLNDGKEGQETTVGVSKDCRFTDEGNMTDFSNFVMRYKGKVITVDFVERNGAYVVVECAGLTPSVN
ncbi:MAG: hypothetical protein LBD04_00900 [Synergistaceae bacterium]|jgi:hypothetical protein|nr:hypothetical protein [Synergistaceae bacterium]